MLQRRLLCLVVAVGCGTTAADEGLTVLTDEGLPVGGRDACALDDGEAVCLETPEASVPVDVPHFVARIDTETWRAWRDVVLPADDELAWTTIDWLPTFGEGLAGADAADKPLLMWAMNGHPLGCT